MKANPIIPIWFMTVICIILVILLMYDRQKKIKKLKENSNKKSNIKKYNINTTIEIIIISVLFIINLRIMIPNGEINTIESDLDIMFVVDTSVSMKALDYDGQKERLEGVINDCCYIVDELSGCKFSIITFGDTVQRLIPFTTDSDMVQAELNGEFPGGQTLILDAANGGVGIPAENPNLSEETVKKVNEVLEAIKNGEIEVKEEL